jgi:uncharacterized membrane protein
MRRLAFFSVVLLIALLWLVAPVVAQSKSVHAKSYDVDLTVLPNGDLQVVETLEMAFQGGPFSYGFRVIPTDRLDSITDIEVQEGGRAYAYSGSGGEYTYRVNQSEDDVEVRWYYPYTSNATRTFEIAYTVKGAVRRYDEGDEVWWMAVHDDHPYLIRTSRVTLQLPDGVAINMRDGGKGYVAETDGVGADFTVDPTRRTVTAVATEPLESGDFLALGVKFTPGAVGGGKPGWQADYDDQVSWDNGGRQVLNLLLGFLGLLTLIGAPLAVYLLWYTRGRDPHVGLVADYLPEPPDDAPPGIAGTLVDEKADLQDVVATMIDLARRGYLTITEEAEKGFGGLTFKQDFVFERTDKEWSDLRDYEVTLLRKLLGRKSSKRMSDLKNKFYTALPAIREGLYDSVVEEGYFRSSPDKTRRNYMILGFVLGAIALTLAIVTTALFVEWVDAIWCPAVGILVGTVALVVVGQAMPAKTPKGAEATARWRAFRSYLKEIERYTDLETATELFERYLPYAIAFNLERRWVKKFTRIEATPIPGWYFPYWVSGRGAHRSSGGYSGSSEGGSGPTVQSMSDGLAGGLQSMSDGLVSMFNSVGKTMTSAPSSSGSGGFSGGGFSGGGSSGGGSSGFG